MMKSISALIQKLVEGGVLVYALAFLFFYVGGAVLLATAATGGWPQFGVPVVEPLWRDIIGVVGFIFLSLAAVLTFITLRIGPRKPPNKRRFAVSVDRPRFGEGVKLPCRVKGKCKKLPEDLKLYLVVLRKNGELTLHWPQDPIDVSDGHWKTTLKAGDAKVGEMRAFAMFVVGEDGQALIQHYRVAGEEKSEIANKIDYTAITKLTSDMVRCADCEVEVVQTESSMQIA
jgi:hypothetical protein